MFTVTTNGSQQLSTLDQITQQMRSNNPRNAIPSTQQPNRLSNQHSQSSSLSPATIVQTPQSVNSNSSNSTRSNANANGSTNTNASGTATSQTFLRDFEESNGASTASSTSFVTQSQFEHRTQDILNAIQESNRILIRRTASVFWNQRAHGAVLSALFRFNKYPSYEEIVKALVDAGQISASVDMDLEPAFKERALKYLRDKRSAKGADIREYANSKLNGVSKQDMNLTVAFIKEVAAHVFTSSSRRHQASRRVTDDDFKWTHRVLARWRIGRTNEHPEADSAGVLEMNNDDEERLARLIPDNPNDL